MILATYQSKHTGAEIDAAIDAAKAALPAKGGTMTGPLILHGNPSANLGAATKQYVDSAISEIELTPGVDGVDGVSCTHSWDGTILTVSSASGTSSADLRGEQGIQGESGRDGVSPTVATEKITGGHRVTITDANGSKSFDVMDGEDGADGDGGDGSGDMLKSIYDADGDGVVDNASKLGGKTPDSYAAASHTHTKADVGLGNVPNVATNDQTPTYSDTTSLQTLSSGEKLNIALQKIKCAITNLINHLNNKNNPHGVTASQINAATSGHSHALTDGVITGTLPISKGGTGANSAAGARKNLGFAYSESELETGDVWIDGKPIYRQIFSGTVTPSSDGGTANGKAGSIGTIQNVDTAINIYGVVLRGTAYYPITMYAAEKNHHRVAIAGESVQFTTTHTATAKAIIEYTKTT